ncbi:MAG: class I SAM-dependent methyltransferase [Planctomycetaceae bacterium]
MQTSRSPRARQFAEQILCTCAPFLPKQPDELNVLDVGCGYGATSLALSERCRSVTGIDPSATMISSALKARDAAGCQGVDFQRAGVMDFRPHGVFDLIVLDNVFEHLPDQRRALERIADWLASGGVCFLLTPNKLWPIEAHYRLPGLSYLPLAWANRYLRWSGRGTDYEDCSYAPTYGGLKRLCHNLPGVTAEFALPANMSLTTRGNVLSYRLGAWLLRKCSGFWWVSKSLLVVLRKDPA